MVSLKDMKQAAKTTIEAARQAIREDEQKISDIRNHIANKEGEIEGILIMLNLTGCEGDSLVGEVLSERFP